MADIDLIPNDYRNWLAQRSIVARYIAAIALLNVMIVVATLGFGQMAERAQAKATQLKSENAITQQQQIQLQQLKDQQSEYERQWSLLRGLRAGAAIDDIFTLIDRSLIAGDLWFIDWTFRRAGVIVDGEQRGVETGYFIIVAEENDPLADLDLGVETHMTIHGQARDHQALSKFVRALFEQQGIKDVNVQKTSQTDYANGHAVDFDMSVVLNSALKDT
ncbi:MAG: PilN domain-containing protein [Gammaproteobacteria bacterium]|nr:PilN domain-containing protein [Gammaproteobacteria bacterium]MDH3374180.1 PilN domain-containing protein [Gammaproteobacteria bacterium]MDH3408919.1 PilN domain-containing protein [Gammaproteobacteria bacterium]MDH3552818.1 PilN domain-containing protein [Gammaproteobacteria bacterium]